MWTRFEGSWRPVVLLKQHLGPLPMMAFKRLAGFCMVTSLHDGMNPVAKELAASRYDEGGALILSRFTGASRELTDALRVNPFDVDKCAGAIRSALEMPEEERRRMQRMRAAVAENNICRWAAKMLSALLRFDFPPATAEIEENVLWAQSKTSF